MAEDPLFSPFTVKRLTLRNRIVSTSHEPAYSEDGLPTDRYRAYHVEKARGGVGLTMIGGSAIVSRDSAPAFGNLQLWKPEAEPLLRRLADEVHEQGAAVMTQLTHMGQRTSSYTDEWLPAVSASPTREPAHRAFAKQAEQWDLDRIKADFVHAAQMCEAAGLDGVELMLYGHFLDSFWTPFWNQRDDEYGGSYENRMRYPREVVRAIRAAVSDDFVLVARMTVDEVRVPGLAVDELVRIARDIGDDGIDMLSLVLGSIHSDVALSRQITSMGTPSAPFLEAVGAVRAQVGLPVMHASRIADVPTARHAIEAGLLDLVGMTRALMADPYLPLKTATGRADQVRPCVGASMCIDGIYASGAAYCLHNPSTGREREVPHLIEPAPVRRRIAVVGGGPAGLEAARVLGERGHEVVLFEAASQLGGQLLLASSSPRRRDLIGVVDWRVQELARLGVTVRLSTYADASDLDGFEVVVVATGGVPRSLDVPGGELAVDGWDVISGARRVSGTVLVYDDHGGNQALDAIEALLRQGAQVEHVTPERSVSPEVGSLIGAGYLTALAGQGVRHTLLRRLRSIERTPEGLLVTLEAEGVARTETRLVDAVVTELGTWPVTEVYDELRKGSTNEGEVQLDALLELRPQTAVRNPDGAYQLFRIGDAVASRNVHAAVLDAARLARAL